MTEEQKAKKAARERERRARLKENAKLDMQAPIDPAPESAMQITEEQMEKYRQELQPQPVLSEEPLTTFEVLRRRMARESRR